MRIHISLNVKTLNDSIGFYSHLFGQAASKERDGYANFRLDSPPIHLALVEDEGRTGEGVSHLGVELPDADTLAAWRDRLESSGADFAIEDQAACCYAKADKLWLSDPDGYRWEIWVRTGEYEAMGATNAVPARNPEEAAHPAARTPSSRTVDQPCCPGTGPVSA